MNENWIGNILGVVFGIFIINFVIDVLFGINIIEIVVDKFNKS